MHGELVVCMCTSGIYYVCMRKARGATAVSSLRVVADSLKVTLAEMGYFYCMLTFSKSTVICVCFEVGMISW